MTQDAVAIYNEGYYYYTGSNGYPLNHAKALECFRNAAELGISNAMNYLALMYEQGDYVQQNDEVSAHWFAKAFQADKNNPYALYNLGRLYYNGKGVQKDIERAYLLCKKAVDLGIGNTHSVYAQSCYLTGCILMEHYNNKKEVYRYFLEAAKYGNLPEAWHNLGWLSEQGEVPVEDSSGNIKAARDGMARGFYEDAAKLGFIQSMDALGRLYILYRMPDQARYWLEIAASKGYEPSKKRLKMLNVSESGSLIDFFK